MIRNHFAVPTVAVLMVSGLALASAPAVRAEPGVFADQLVHASAQKNSPSAKQLKLTQDGYDAYRDISATRVAIFNANVTGAKALLDDAKQKLLKLSDNAAEATIEEMTTSGTDKPVITHWVSGDGKVDVVDDYQADDVKMAHVKAANEKLMAGEHQKAAEELKLANIDVTYSRLLMPLEATLTDVNKAIDMIGKGRIYEANVVLKGAENAFKWNTVSVLEAPKT